MTVEAGARRLPCGCMGLVQISSSNNIPFIADVVEYCDHHHEHWYRGFLPPDDYFDRKVDHELAGWLHDALRSVIRGEPIELEATDGILRKLSRSAPQERIDAILQHALRNPEAWPRLLEYARQYMRDMPHVTANLFMRETLARVHKATHKADFAGPFNEEYAAWKAVRSEG